MKTPTANSSTDPHNAISRLRKRLRHLLDEREALVWKLADSGPMIRGCFYSVMKTCTQFNCRCQRGEKHGPFPALSWSVNGRRKMVMVRGEDARTVEQKVKLYRLFVRGLRELGRLNDHVDRVLRQIMELLREEYQ